MRIGFLALILVGILVLTNGCGGDNPTPTAVDQSPVAAPSATDVQTSVEPVIDKKFRVGSPEQELAIRCWGSGAPAVILDAGSSSGGIETFGAFPDQIIWPLAERSMVCAYDRAGTGETAPLPNKRRTIDDQAEELTALLAAAEVPTPRVLVGSSWGGFVAVHTARNYPDGVGGLVLLDVPAGNPHLTAADAPDAAWDHPANVERVDSFHAERTMARDDRSLGDLPVAVVTADAGQSDPKDQQFWKRLSNNFSQVVLAGSHDIYADDPGGVVDQIRKTVDAAG
jgi:Alpha/beta hydrolase family